MEHGGYNDTAMTEKLADIIPGGELEDGEFETVVEIWLFPLLIALYSLGPLIVLRRCKKRRESVFEAIENTELGGSPRSLNSAKALVRTGSGRSAKNDRVSICSDDTLSSKDILRHSKGTTVAIQRQAFAEAGFRVYEGMPDAAPSDYDILWALSTRSRQMRIKYCDSYVLMTPSGVGHVSYWS